MSWNPLERLDDRRQRLLKEFEALLVEFNRHINLISREDEEHVWLHHVVHCLFLTYRRFPSGATVVDWGTGGGLPAIPLAIAFPGVQFVAVDAIHKKVHAVRAIVRRLGLDNVEVHQSRADDFEAEAAYSVSRATAPLKKLWSWHQHLKTPDSIVVDESCWLPGLICLKGGELDAEIAEVTPRAKVERIALSNLTDEPHFRDKAIVVCTPHVELPTNPYR